jgi:hypothetical protein
MNEWVLIMTLVVYGGRADTVAMSQVEGFASSESCIRAATFWRDRAKLVGTPIAVCVSKAR